MEFKCERCNIRVDECALPMCSDALSKRLCTLCYLRNRATQLDESLNCMYATDDKGSTLEYFVPSYPVIALVTWNESQCAHLCELTPKTTGYIDDL